MTKTNLKNNGLKAWICALILFCSPFFALSSALAHGDGYTDCELDPIYESNAKGKPVTGLFLRERACMTDSEILKTLPAGEEVNIIAETDGWYKVRDKTGAIGWSGERLIEITEESTIRNRLGSEYYSSGVNKGVDDAARIKLMERVRGYILLQVEAHGEAWYVDPVSEKRTYLKDGAAAFQIMRNFGLGVTNADLAKIQAGDRGLLNRLSGRIVLQVEAHGEAYYIHPGNLGVHYLKNGNEAYRIMRELSLGITDDDLEMVAE